MRRKVGVVGSAGHDQCESPKEAEKDKWSKRKEKMANKDLKKET